MSQDIIISLVLLLEMLGMWDGIDRKESFHESEESFLILSTLNQLTSGLLYFFRSPRAGLFSMKIWKNF